MTASRIHCRPPRDERWPPRISCEDADLLAYSTDAAHWTGDPESVAFPASEGEWSWLLSRPGPLLVVGDRSSLTAGATPAAGGTVASTDAMRRLVMGEDELHVGAGLALAAMEEALDGRGLVFPPVPTYTGARVGGVIATNAAGAATFKHGTTRDWVLGLTVVLPGGDVLEVERGECVADADGAFEIVRTDGEAARVPVPRYRLPDVPKCSAGYHAADGMDLIDLFIGSEGTLGAVIEARLRAAPCTWEPLVLLALLRSESEAMRMVARLREESLATRAGDGRGLDVSAIESMDARCLELLREDGVGSRLGVGLRAEHETALLVVVDLPLGTTAEQVQDDLASFGEEGAPPSPVHELCRILADADAFDDTIVVLPGDTPRLADVLAFREAVPEAVNARVGRLKREVDSRIHKVAGDVIVPFEHLNEMLRLCRDIPGERGLEVAVWGHASDGNLHPNVIPRTGEDVAAGEEAILELGREVIRLGGSPMAEHGVGRHPVKQRLLVEMHGEEGLADMKAVKHALDPDGILAPGVLWS